MGKDWKTSLSGTALKKTLNLPKCQVFCSLCSVLVANLTWSGCLIRSYSKWAKRGALRWHLHDGSLLATFGCRGAVLAFLQLASIIRVDLPLVTGLGSKVFGKTQEECLQVSGEEC